MPVICWGELGKSASDPSTIDDEIGAYLLRHNVDPNAHGLSGYSLYNHRADKIIDHVDYCIISDKITANQIVGKDFRTAPDVGEEVDGIKFDPNAIEMWEGGYKKVYIPKSGNPSFDGDLTVRALYYYRRIIQVNCQSLEPFNSLNFVEHEGLNIKVYSQRYTYNEGRARLTTGVTDDEMQVALDPSLEITAEAGLFDEKLLCYMGLGSMSEKEAERHTAGFMFSEGKCYMFSQQTDEGWIPHMYATMLGDVNINKMYIYRVRYDHNNRMYQYFVNNVFRGEQYAHWPIGDLDQLCDILVYPKTSKNVDVKVFNIVFQQNFPSL